MSFLQRVDVKSNDQIALMRKAGAVVGQTLEILREAAQPGVSLAELNALAE